jgi:uncharacterized protein (TIGR02145 family)
MKTRNTMRFYFSIISCLLFLFLGCKDTSSTINPDDTTVIDSTFTDIRDYRKYTIVKIGKQVWMSENLNASTYRNGNPIRYARTIEEWQDAANKNEGAWCYYKYDPKNGEIYGKLYNWYSVKDARGLAPTGYHIPSDLEWSLLTEYLGGEAIAGQKLKSKSGWTGSGNGDNSSGFKSLPGGFCVDDGYFYGITEFSFFWSSSEDDAYDAWDRELYYDTTKVGRDNNYKKYGMSVRCLRD